MNESYPQPREGITGTVRDQDDLLSLDEKALPVRKMITGLAKCLQRATLVGNPAPVVARMHARLSDPQPGDLVVEMSRLGSGHLEVEAFGILLAHRVEWWETDEEWAQQVEAERAAYERFLAGPYSQPGDGPFDPSTCERLTDHAWYVQYGPRPENVCRWVNCSFMVIPDDPGIFETRFGTRTGNGVTITRSDLVESLGDAGFQLRGGSS